MTLVGVITKDAKKIILIFEMLSKSKKFIDFHSETIKDYASKAQNKYKDINKEIKVKRKFSLYNK